MIKKILVLMVVIALTLTGTVGCSQESKPSSSTGSTIIKTVEVGTQWNVNQVRVNIDGNDELLLLLKLASGDKVDGYFYLEKGEHIDFNITGNTLLYTAKAQEESDQIDSDRFAFIASQSQGTTYTLTFRNKDKSQVTAFLELIYPSEASMFVPVVTD